MHGLGTTMLLRANLMPVIGLQGVPGLKPTMLLQQLLPSGMVRIAPAGRFLYNWLTSHQPYATRRLDFAASMVLAAVNLMNARVN
mmetsp:Transcript_5912/g.14584  ORF Transcript_5912/g.14584 Transcript_5912/m.14584 type:complete len:85 (+) Transcript_5912:1274-1528(+)